MSENNVVDDYYANLSSKEETQADNKEVKKLKLKVKKKTIVKKVDNQEKESTSFKKEKNIETEVKPKKIIQKIKIVKKQEKNIKPQINQEKKNEKKLESLQIKKEVENPKDLNNKKENFRRKTFKPNVKKEEKEENQEERKIFRKNKFQWKKTRWKIKFIEENNFVRSSKLNKKKKEEKKIEDIKQNLVDHKWETIVISDFLTLKEFSEKIWVALPKLIWEFMKNWMMLNINSKVDFDSASIIAESFEIKLERDNSSWIKIEDIIDWDLDILLAEDDLKKLKPRSPIISIMWHVDHWKTSLLDYIRKTKITSW